MRVLGTGGVFLRTTLWAGPTGLSFLMVQAAWVRIAPPHLASADSVHSFSTTHVATKLTVQVFATQGDILVRAGP